MDRNCLNRPEAQQLMAGAPLAIPEVREEQLVPRPRDLVLTKTRSLTLGALIGAPTVREGLPAMELDYAVEGLGSDSSTGGFFICPIIPI
jgi:hypothetical protein